MLESLLLRAATQSLTDFPPIFVAFSLRADTEIPVTKMSPRRATQLIQGRRIHRARERSELESVVQSNGHPVLVFRTRELRFRLKLINSSSREDAGPH